MIGPLSRLLSVGQTKEIRRPRPEPSLSISTTPWPRRPPPPRSTLRSPGQHFRCPRARIFRRKWACRRFLALSPNCFDWYQIVTGFFSIVLGQSGWRGLKVNWSRVTEHRLNFGLIVARTPADRDLIENDVSAENFRRRQKFLLPRGRKFRNFCSLVIQKKGFGHKSPKQTMGWNRKWQKWAVQLSGALNFVRTSIVLLKLNPKYWTKINPRVSCSKFKLDCHFPAERVAFKPTTLQKWALKANMGLGKKVKVLKVLKVNYKT